MAALREASRRPKKGFQKETTVTYTAAEVLDQRPPGIDITNFEKDIAWFTGVPLLLGARARYIRVGSAERRMLHGFQVTYTGLNCWQQGNPRLMLLKESVTGCKGCAAVSRHQPQLSA